MIQFLVTAATTLLIYYLVRHGKMLITSYFKRFIR